jgi:hypothetical protein
MFTVSTALHFRWSKNAGAVRFVSGHDFSRAV